MKLSKLLLVEDNQGAADLIIGILEHAGHTIIHKMTGLEGLQAAQAEFFDGILLDYMLPDMDGLQLCSMLRESFKEVPIILTTAYVDKLSPEDIAAAGLTAFVPKPISQNLVATINKYVTTQSMAHVELKKPENFFKKFLGPFYSE
jgi:CheY-like chemotaxis protein